MQKLWTTFLVVLIVLLPFANSTDAKGLGSSNSKHNRTSTVTMEPPPQEETPIIEEAFPETNDFITNPDAFSYTVQSGDTLWKISLAFETTVEEIKLINQLTSDIILVGQVLLIPSLLPLVEQEPVLATEFLIMGYYTKYWNNDLTSYRSLDTHHSYINSVAITTYQVNATGAIEAIDAPEALQLANEKGVRTYATIQNHFQPELTHALLSNSELRATIIQNIYQLLIDDNFYGVNIDFENMYASDRPLYNQFIKEVSEFLKPKGFDLIVSVTAKTADNPTWAWSGTFDYAFLGQYATLQLMTYDNSGTWSTPGATAGIDWVENVLKYTTSLVPSEKVLIGLPAYGYEWYVTTGKGIRALSLIQIDSLLEKTKATISFDEKTQTPYFIYRDEQGLERIVWFENEASITAKMNLVSKYKLGGVSMWRMGLETEKFWQTVTNYLPN